MMSTKLKWLVLLYGLQGIPYGFQGTFLPVLLHSGGTSLTGVSLMRALNIPWMLKLLWAPFITSSHSVKRPLILSLASLSVIFALTSLVPLDSISTLSVFLLLINILVSIQDIAVDTFAIQNLAGRELGHGNAIQVVAYKFGAMFGGGILTWASQSYSWSTLVNLITCAYFLSTFIVHFCLHPSGKHSSVNADKDNCQLSVHCYEFPETQLTKTRILKKDNDDDHHHENIAMPHHPYNLRSLTKRPVKPSEGFTECSPLSENKSRKYVSDQEESRTDQHCKQSDILTRDSVPAAIVNKNCDFPLRDRKLRNLFSNILDEFCVVFRVPNTTWLFSYLLIYKLGEQAATTIFPLYLLDGGVSTNHIALWVGLISQWVSIAGSLFGGWLIGHSKRNKKTTQRLLLLCLARSFALLFLTLLMHAFISSQNFNHLVLCLPFYIVLILGGTVTTATFTLMMSTSQGAFLPSTQTLHHTTMATAEVLGKVFFTSFAGLLIDKTGYIFGFYAFCVLTVLPILPLLNFSNKSN